MNLCEWDASEGHPGQSCVHLYASILSTSSTSVSIFSVLCYSSVSILMGSKLLEDAGAHFVNSRLLYCRVTADREN